MKTKLSILFALFPFLALAQVPPILHGPTTTNIVNLVPSTNVAGIFNFPAAGSVMVSSGTFDPTYNTPVLTSGSINDSGTLVFINNNVDINGAIGFGGGNNVGTAGQFLTSAGAGVAPTWTSGGASYMARITLLGFDSSIVIPANTTYNYIPETPWANAGTLIAGRRANSAWKGYIQGLDFSGYNNAGSGITAGANLVFYIYTNGVSMSPAPLMTFLVATTSATSAYQTNVVFGTQQYFVDTTGTNTYSLVVSNISASAWGAGSMGTGIQLTAPISNSVPVLVP